MVKNQALPLQGAFVGELKSHAGAAKKKKKNQTQNIWRKRRWKAAGAFHLKGRIKGKWKYAGQAAGDKGAMGLDSKIASSS